ncbi:MAG: VOC family protein [Ilumatobacter sp.]|uniref:VOC family protein n=1 Tax=Ilumatobacter sp. TaxID=1967498 RepID=UPI003C7394D5
MTAQVEWLEVVGDADVWRSLGLVVDAGGLVPLIGACIRIVAPEDEAQFGLAGWALSGSTLGPDASTIDGLPTYVVAPSGPVFGQHELGASGLDHVVVMTNDLDRTTGAITEATGNELRRVREVGTMRQGFHRMGRGGLIVEVVERPEVDDGPASFWGLVLNVDDLDAACERIGDGRISAPKDAVQPGRRIATVSKDVGLGFPVALMTT